MDKIFYKLSPTAQRALLEGPALHPPQDVLPNFANPPNRREAGWAVIILSIVLSSSAVAIRMYSKIFCMKKMELEDFIAITTLGVYAGFQYFMIRIAIYPGYYVHQWDIRLKSLSDFLFNTTTASATHDVVMALLKAAILLDLARIFVPRRQRNAFFWTCHVVIWINILFYSICAFLRLFGCQPREKIWNRLIPGGRCVNFQALTVASSAVNLPSDLIVFILPQRNIWHLRLSRRKRLGVSAIFATAIFACIAAGARMIHSIPLLHNPDMLYTLAGVGVWAECEVTAGFLILGIPSIPKVLHSSQFVQKSFTRFKAWTISSSRGTKTSSGDDRPSWYKSITPKCQKRENGWSTLGTAEGGSAIMLTLPSADEGNVDGKGRVTERPEIELMTLKEVSPARLATCRN